MTQQDNINLYNAQMAINIKSVKKCTAYILQRLAGGKEGLFEQDLHGGIEYAMAQWKKNIETYEGLTPQQKEEKKMQCESTFRSIESMLKDDLICRHQLL